MNPSQMTLRRQSFSRWWTWATEDPDRRHLFEPFRRFGKDPVWTPRDVYAAEDRVLAQWRKDRPCYVCGRPARRDGIRFSGARGAVAPPVHFECRPVDV